MKSASSEHDQAPGDAHELGRPVRHNRLPVVLFRLADGQIIEASDSLTALFGGSRDEMVGRAVLDFIIDEPATRARLALMIAGELDGYHVMDRRYRRLDGSEFTVDTYVNSFGSPPVNCAVGVLMPQGNARPMPTGSPDPTGAVVLGTVDRDWQIDRVSADVERLLGHGPGEVLGEPIASFVEPSDVPALLVGVGRGLQMPGSATIRVRMRTADGPPRACRMLVARLAGHTAEGLGFAFAITDRRFAHVVERAWELERVLQHIAREIEATGVLAGLWGTPAATSVPALAGLSARELEIVTRLLMGDRVPMIAQQLFLSESTVRNHLTSVYRKLGVRSQQQLLNLLRAEQVHGNLGGSV